MAPFRDSLDSQRIFTGDFVHYVVDWENRQLVVRRPSTELYEEGEPVYLTIEPQHCVLLES